MDEQSVSGPAIHPTDNPSPATPDQPVPSRPTSSLFAVLGALFIATVALVGFALVNERTDMTEQARRDVADLRTHVREMTLLERLVANGDLDRRAVEAELARHRNEVSTLLSAIDEPQREDLRSAFADYAAAAGEVTSLVSAGRNAEAASLYGALAAPRSERLQSLIEATENQVIAREQRVDRMRRIAGSSVLVGTVFGISGLSWLLERQRRSAAVAAAESASQQRSAARFRALVEHSFDLVMVLGPDGRVRYISPSAQRIYGRRPEEMIGLDGPDTVHPEDRARIADRFQVVLASQEGSHALELVRVLHADGSVRYLEGVATNCLRNPDIGGIVVNARDITERKQAEEQLAYQAFHDALTGLPNRALLQDRLSHALARSRRQPRPLAVLLLDLDGFKAINDSLGHAAGDQVLQTVAQRLRACVREEDTVARLGGDEFAVLLEDVRDASDAQSSAERLLDALKRPLMVADRPLVTKASIGIAISENGQETVDEVLRNADLAMYAAKLDGKDRHRFFDSKMHSAAVDRLALEQDLRLALEAGQMVVHYQPIVCLDQGEITGVEALVRWNHPERGLLPPEDFIPIAEETGLIQPLGRWVLREACGQVAAWQAMRPGGRQLRVSVNVSVYQLADEGWVSYVAQVLAETKLAPECLMLEITESTLMRNTSATVQQLQALKELGVQLAIDDFGTGYSSLSYLRQFPIDVLKIDKSFITSLTHDHGESEIVAAILRLGHSLNLKVLAEGIEEPEQAEQLHELHCELGQGFYFSLPAPANEVERLLSDTRPVSFRLGTPLPHAGPG